MAQIAFTGVERMYRGRGIGQALKAASIQACRDWGAAVVTTTVLRDNLQAKRLNERLGFVEAPNQKSTKLVRLYLDLCAESSAEKVAPEPMGRTSRSPDPAALIHPLR
jgi:GNAT superfamily N-acetyltransferase